MQSLYIRVYYLVFIGAFFLTSCGSMPYIATGEMFDPAYPLIGNVVETGALLFVKKNIFHHKTAMPAEPDIAVSGNTSDLGFGKIITQLSYQNAYQPDMILLNWQHTTVFWNGTISLGDTVTQAKLIIDTYGENSTSIFVLRTAKAPAAHIAVVGPISKTTAVIHNPYWFCTFFSETAEYQVFGSMPEQIYQQNPENSNYSDTEKERLVAQYQELRRGDVYRFFCDKQQKFQILDSLQTVVAEIADNNYTIYDTLPESEKESIKQNIALFFMFRYLTKTTI